MAGAYTVLAKLLHNKIVPHMTNTIHVINNEKCKYARFLEFHACGDNRL